MDITKQKAQTNEGMLKEAERIFDEFAETLKKQVVSSPTQNFIVDWKSKFKEFVSLVKRMREAQKENKAFESEMYRKYRGNDWFMSEGEQIKEQELYNKVFDLESEVDEYLKKMEE